MLAIKHATIAASSGIFAFCVLLSVVLLLDRWNRWYVRVLRAVFTVSFGFTMFAFIGMVVVGRAGL